MLGEAIEALRMALGEAPRHAGLLVAVVPLVLLALLAALNLLALLRVSRRVEACRRSVEALAARMSEADAARKSKNEEGRRILRGLVDGFGAASGRRE